MIIGTNIILILIVGLIAYWWANQGFFSALLHLLCVIVAGAIALAFWEPLTTGLLLTGRSFDDYAWGVSLVGLFVISLFVLRLSADKLVPANVNIPRWANLAFGGAAGVVSGVLSTGILVIGLGHIQSTAKIAGFRDQGRSGRTGEVGPRAGALWIPFHQVTNEFYGWLSVTSLRTGRPLRHYSPGLHQQASLLRDSFDEGKGKLSLLPSAAEVQSLSMQSAPDGVIYYVKVRLGVEAQDFGEQLTLSASQIRLIGEPNPPRTGKAPFAHPFAWTQYSGRHQFDNISHYAVSEPGKESSSPVFEFKVPADFIPAFILIRGTRFAVPQATRGTGPVASGANERASIPVGGGSIQSAIRVSNDVRPVSVSTNSMPSGIQERDKYLTEGKGTFERGGRLVSRTLKILGIFEPAGTKVVRVDVSRGGAADIFALSSKVKDGARLRLIDDSGNEYTPIGYFYTHADGVTIELQPKKRTATLDDIPIPPTSGDQKLELLFYVTAKAVVKGMRFGDIDVGTCDFEVKGKSR